MLIINKAPAVVDLKLTDFGIVLDGITDNSQAFNNLLNEARNLGGARIYGPKGTVGVTGVRAMPNNTSFVGDWRLKTLYTGSDNRLKAPIWWGNFHPHQIGWRPIGTTGSFTSYTDYYSAKDGCSSKDDRITLIDPEDTSKFRLNEVYHIRTSEFGIQLQSGEGVEYVIPNEMSLVKIVSIESNGTLVFDKHIGFNSSTPPIIGVSESNNSEGNIIPRFFVKDSSIDIEVEARVAFGHHATGAYNCTGHIRDFLGTAAFISNGLAWCNFQVDGTFAGPVVEVKFGSHNTYVRVNGSIPEQKESNLGVVSIGERTRDVHISCNIDAPDWTDAALFQLSQARDCSLKGTINAPNSTYAAITMNVDLLRVEPMRRISLDAKVTHKAINTITCGTTDNPFVPDSCEIKVESTSGYEGSSTERAIWCQGGTNNVFDIKSNRGRVEANAGVGDGVGAVRNTFKGLVGDTNYTGVNRDLNTNLTTQFV